MLDARLNRSEEARADSVDLLIARVGRKQGDYAGALETFRKQLELAEKSGDQQQIGMLHRECGAVLFAQERYPEAARYFDRSTTIFKTLDNKALHANSLLSLSSALWRMGHYPEGAAALEEAIASAGEPGGGNKDVLAALHAERAWLELSRGDIPEARESVKAALAVGGNEPTLVAEVGGVLCLAAARSGSAAKGKASCEEFLEKSKEAGDPWFVSNAELSLAEALLEAGEYGAAREAALRAYDIAAPAGRIDSAWRAMAVAGAASRRAGDAERAREQSARAKELLTKLEPDWGSEAMSVYLTRPDLRSLRRELDGHTTAAPKP
jgi:tetratricopeptide (TPR) repeat protein